MKCLIDLGQTMEQHYKWIEAIGGGVSVLSNQTICSCSQESAAEPHIASPVTPITDPSVNWAAFRAGETLRPYHDLTDVRFRTTAYIAGFWRETRSDYAR